MARQGDARAAAARAWSQVGVRAATDGSDADRQARWELLRDADLGGPGGSEYDAPPLPADAPPERLMELSRQLAVWADEEDELALHEAWDTPSWAPVRPAEIGHRAAATALRACARSLEFEARMWGVR